MFILWFVVGVVIGGLAAYANAAYRFAQVARALIEQGGTLERIGGRWYVTSRKHDTFTSAPAESLAAFLFRYAASVIKQ